MDSVKSILKRGPRTISSAVGARGGVIQLSKRTVGSESAARNLDGEYVLRPVPGQSGKFYLGFSKDKMASLKDLSFIDFTKDNKVNKGDFLLSVESAKTMFDFMSPATLKIIALNKKFVEKPTEDVLKELKEKPELDDNYLMVVEMD
ncbi:glycine cleavage system H protein, putative [Babesia ovis]|uniref:Glycine cleavage system H protein, putative n=1 Tax=Babesia ovis TaxID=5869 RepID=A0A9W5T814_BABOV|nr:glycine cleavage system H protein, putative [Babesia ovis]